MKVRSVKKTDKKKKVYDLEVPVYHNFSITNGIIVHNSIDMTRYATERVWRKRGQ